MRKELSNSSLPEEKTHWLRKWVTIIPIAITISVGLVVYLGGTKSLLLKSTQIC